MGQQCSETAYHKLSFAAAKTLECYSNHSTYTGRFKLSTLYYPSMVSLKIVERRSVVVMYYSLVESSDFQLTWECSIKERGIRAGYACSRCFIWPNSLNWIDQFQSSMCIGFFINIIRWSNHFHRSTISSFKRWTWAPSKRGDLPFTQIG